jgi:hypothetical protein
MENAESHAGAPSLSLRFLQGQGGLLTLKVRHDPEGGLRSALTTSICHQKAVYLAA